MTTNSHKRPKALLLRNATAPLQSAARCEASVCNANPIGSLGRDAASMERNLKNAPSVRSVLVLLVTIAFSSPWSSAYAQSQEAPATAESTPAETTGSEEETAKPFVVDRNTRTPAPKLTPRIDNIPIEPVVTPNFIPIPGTKAVFQIGGDVTTVVTGTSKEFSPTWWITSEIPVNGQPGFNSHYQLAFTANESDINFEFNVPSPLGALRVVYNNDFSQPSSAFSYHLNYFYTQAGNLLFGFSDSVFADVDSYPSTLDYEGTNSLVFSRHAMVSYALPIDKKKSHQLFVKLSLEIPDSQISTGTSGTETSRQVVPDFGAQIRLEGGAGHVQLATILRVLGAQNTTTGSTQSAFGWGLNLTAGLNLWGGDYLSLGVAGGQGLAAYFNDTGGSGLDATFNSAGNLTALSILGVFVGYTHNWTSKWSSTGSYGFLTMDDTSYQASLGAGGFHQSQYASLNIVYHPWPKLLVGIEGLYGFHKTVNEATGDAWRGQLDLQYTF